jgi:hypothetical protein
MPTNCGQHNSKGNSTQRAGGVDFELDKPVDFIS